VETAQLSMSAHWRFRLRAMLRHPELQVLIALILLTACALAFVWLAGEVTEGDTRAFDRVILLSMRDAADSSIMRGPTWLPEVARDITSLGSAAVLTLIAVAVVGFLVVVQARSAALLLAGALLGGGVLSTILKQYFERPRPDLVTHAVDVSSASFPSGHAMLSTVTYLTLAALLTRLQLTPAAKAYLMLSAVGFSVLIGISRIYLGVHWPTDVIAGWSVGAAWAVGCWLIARALQRRGVVETRADG
jgi:undecaprenyl-diphosphatase